MGMDRALLKPRYHVFYFPKDGLIIQGKKQFYLTGESIVPSYLFLKEKEMFYRPYPKLDKHLSSVIDW